MTLDELRGKVPDIFKPWVDEYGPILVVLSAVEIKRYIELLVTGNVHAALTSILTKMPDQEFIAHVASVTATGDSLNNANVESIVLQKRALNAMASIILSLLLSMVGL